MKAGRYLKTTLQPGEKILKVGKIHPVFLLFPFLLSVIFIAGIIWIGRQLEFTKISPWIWAVQSLPVLYFVQELLFYITSETALTSHRILAKSGFISRKTSEVSLEKIESFALEQNLLERIFGCGDLIVKGTGGHEVALIAIEKIMSFRAVVQTTVAH